MKPIRLAIIGGGVIGRRHAGAIADDPTAELVGVVDPALTGKVLAFDMGIPLYGDVQALFDAVSVDGVIVSTPTEHHCPPTLAALKAGAHVLVEKPIMPTIEQAEQITAFSEEVKRHVMVGHHRRYYAQVHKTREIIQSGVLGQLVAVSGQWTVRKNANYYDPNWRKNWEAGPILTNLIHEVDTLRYVCGEIASISAEISNGVMNFEKEDVAAMVMRFESGALGTFVVSDRATSPWAWEFSTGETPAFPKTGQNCVRFMGTKAALDFPNLALWHHGDGAPDWNHAINPDEIPLELGNAYARQISHFCAVISGDEEPRITARDATKTLRATLAVFDAAKSGNRVML
jgi:predicted dehydrogenase